MPEPTVPSDPISFVEWVHRDTLTANDYNPNKVMPTELNLLEQSILEDGWTQPIVRRDGGEIVDGFHRWTVSGRPKLMERYGGMVPVVTMNPTNAAHQRMSTIRHNRARGSHYVLAMADIVSFLAEQGIDDEEARRRLGMDREEWTRLLERGDMVARGSADAFTEAWRPAHKARS